MKSALKPTVSPGERHREPLGGETNLTTEQDNRAHSQHLSLVQQDPALCASSQEMSEKVYCGQPKLCPAIDAHNLVCSFSLNYILIIERKKRALLSVYIPPPNPGQLPFFIAATCETSASSACLFSWYFHGVLFPSSSTTVNALLS